MTWNQPRVVVALAVLSVALLIGLSVRTRAADEPAKSAQPTPIKPVGADGKPLNLDFEDGTLKDWTATGNAFKGQPIKGDTVSPRRGDMKSGHQGNYWIGGFEVAGDDGTGTLTSAAFKVSHRWASFLVAGGPWPKTCVELVNAADKKVFFRVSGYESEELRPVVIDLQPQLGGEIFIRLVDQQKGHWGHLNFDNFVFYEARPTFANELEPSKVVAQIPEPDAVKFAGLKPEEAAKSMSLPPGFKATLFAGEPDVVQPIAFTIDARGRLWVVQGMTYPIRQPEGQGKDSILVFEDTDGDGRFDKRTVFTEGLNLVSGIEVGFGGVWVGAAPYLMFIPTDETADEPKPTGKPQILLDGFGYGDTHETLNTFTWGPDGWLYGCHGVFTESRVGKPGLPKDSPERVHINAGIFRYHPTKHTFERFAEGTSNPWGIDFDEHGQCIIEACVIPHLWHIVQNGRYQRQAGQHDNPYTFADIQTIADHVHWAGNKGPHAGNGRSDAMGGGHAHAGLLVYQGDNWPAEWRGKVFMNNIHGSRLNMDVLEPQGSGFVGHHGNDFCLFNDAWSQIVNLRAGPDGGVYLIDWYDKNQCHNTNTNIHDRTNGRIFKITYGDVKKPAVNLAKADDAQLWDLQADRNESTVGTARRLLQERGSIGKLDAQAASKVRFKFDTDADAAVGLRKMWAMHAAGLLTSEIEPALLTGPPPAQEGLNKHPHALGWIIQLICEGKNPSDVAVREFVRLAKDHPSPIVRLYLASAVLRIPVEERADILAGLLSHSEDAADHNLPLMYWYGLESICAAQPERALSMAQETKIPNLLSFTVRRLGATGSDSALASLVDVLGKSDAPRQLEIVRGLNAALKGRRSVAMPKGWDAIEPRLLARGDEQLRSQSQMLAVTFGSKTAAESMRKLLADPAAPEAARQAALESLSGAKDPALAPVLQSLLRDAKLRGPALRALAGYDDPNTAKAILAAYDKLNATERKDALVTLAARTSFARELVAAVGHGPVSPKDLSADIVRQLRSLGDADLDKQIEKVWGTLRATPQDKLKRMAQLRFVVEKSARSPDLGHGRLLFNKTCSQCHTLFDAGGKVGPDITGSNRADVAYLLENVVDPNAIIPADYQASILDTKDGRTVIGIVKSKPDAAVVTIATQNETLTIPRNEVERLRPSQLSMMPEGILDNFPENDVRDLIGYLRSPKQVPMPEGADAGTGAAAAAPAGAAEGAASGEKAVLFNGKDLSNWDTHGVEGLWSVQDGELVGKTEKGLKRNEFLSSKESYGDFRLVVKIKLVPNEANSGIQFHSERFEGNEMSGPQADAGKGWWGKVYGENFGNKVIGENKSGEDIVKSNEWNTYEVLAVGPKIRTAINGHPCADIEDPKYVRKGMFGLQVHAGGPTEVRFKDFDFELNPKAELKTVKEGK